MSELKVVFADLVSASRSFHEHGREFGDLAPKSGPPVPHVNESTLQATLPKVLQAIGAMHDAVASSMEAHSVKLQRAHDVYTHHEQKTKALIDSLQKVLSSPDAIQ
jgi:hypothetical protein